MSKAFIYTVNQSAQSVAANGVVSPGSVIRRFGCNLHLSGNGIQVQGPGFYSLDACVVCTPSAAGTVSATLLKDGVPISGASASATVAAANTTVTLPIMTAIRENCCSDSASAITCVISVSASVSNFTFRAEKK